MIMKPEITAVILRIARKMAASTGADVDDLNQEGLIAAWKAEASCDGRTAVDKRCYWLARRAMIDYIRRTSWGRRKARRPVLVSLTDCDILAIPPTAPRSIEFRQAMEALNRAPMTPCCREALLATTIGDMTQAQYSKQIGKTYGYVSQMVARAVKVLRAENCVQV